MSKPIVLVGEAKGENEVKINSSFVGAAGIELLRMLNEAGIISLSPEDHDLISRFWKAGDPRFIEHIWKSHPQVYRTNVFQIHPPGNKLEFFCVTKTQAKEEGIPILPNYHALTKGRFVRAEYEPELDRLADELMEQDPNVIVCLGNAALWALTGQTAISKRRGATCLSTHCVTGFKLLPTYHPSAVLHQWELRPVTIVDLQKAKAEAGWPEIRRPHREIWIEPIIADLYDFFERYIRRCDRLSVDIETAGNQVTCIGFAPTPEIAIVIPFADARKKGRSYWPDTKTEHEAWLFVRSVLENKDIKKTFQNGLYDIAFNWRSHKIKTYGAEHDTMLLHHALQPESLKGLGFLGSIYTDEGPWKTERKGTSTIKADE